MKLETPQDAISARCHAAEKISGSLKLEDRSFSYPDDFFTYCFELQVELEKAKEMGYYKYAAKMWQAIAPAIINDSLEMSEEDCGKKLNDGCELFTQYLTTGMHAIKMEDLVFPELTNILPELVDLYGTFVQNLILWSTGDVKETGYQNAKIAKSNIIRKVHKALKVKLGDKAGSAFFNEKTKYLVADNKVDKLVEFVKIQLEENEDHKVKLVIIEDTVNNFEKVRNAILADEGIDANMVEIIPIWYTGSRAGVKAEADVTKLEEAGDPKAAMERAKLTAKKNDLNAISSWEDLRDEKFIEIMKDANVFVDFDGVIANNIEMRTRQALVKYNALVHSLSETLGIEPGQIDDRIKLKMPEFRRITSNAPDSAEPSTATAGK